MKINKEVLKELLGEVKRRQIIAKEYYSTYTAALKEAKSVEELIKAKQDFFLDVLNNLPVIKEDDYFCLLGMRKEEDENSYMCKGCLYGKKHGNCFKPKSDYNIMYDLVCELRHQVIHKFFKKGEKYK